MQGTRRRIQHVTTSNAIKAADMKYTCEKDDRMPQTSIDLTRYDHRYAQSTRMENISTCEESQSHLCGPATNMFLLLEAGSFSGQV